MTVMKDKTTAIIGGGASGLFCASMLSGNVILLERGDRVGRKLSATGNGQGNVTNVHVAPDKYFTTTGQEKIDRCISAFGKDAMLSFLEKRGGLFAADEKGRVYPTCRQASALTDLLRYNMGKNVRAYTGFFVTDIIKNGDRFTVIGQSAGESVKITCDNVVLCTGGKAAKNFGTDGNGYALAEKFGHTVTALYPSLVQLKTDPVYKTLKGIRVNCKVWAYLGAEDTPVTFGDVIFTDYGVSGDAIFRLSAHIADKGAVQIGLDLLPDVTEEQLVHILRRKLNNKNIPQGELLCGILNNQVGRAVMKRCTDNTAESIAKAVKRFILRVTGTLGFDYAQVTKGGVRLDELTGSLESKFVQGLYMAGEILDADGQCGGYNLQWAFSSAATVAEAINGKSQD